MNQFLKPIIGLFFAAIVMVSCNGNKSGEGVSKYQATIDSIAKSNPEIRKISEQININPKDAELFFARGNSFYQLHELVLAASDLHRAIELDSTKTAYYLAFADANIEAHFIKVALQYLQKAKKIAPDDINLSFKLAKTYLYLKEYDAAITETNSILMQDKTNSDAYFMQGMVWKEKADTTKALALFRIAADNNPENYNAYMQLGLLNMFRNKTLSEKYFLNVIRIDSNKYEGNYALAMLYQQYNEHQKAITMYKKMIVQSPTEIQPIYNLGMIYYNTNNLEAAFTHFNLAIGVSPRSADAFYMRGLCWEKRNNKTQAIKDMEAALKLRPDFREALDAISKLKAS
jgi:tetratricopeptide (TPR) repeat protein